MRVRLMTPASFEV